MSDRELSERAEEILADIWGRREREEGASLSVEEIEKAGDEAGMPELVEAGLLEERSGKVALTEEGEREAAAIIRRERLAERLLVDVLDLGDPVAREAACQFEHLLRKGIDDEICTLLGHPKVCPHGSAIPPGDCCRQREREPGKVVSTLADLSPGQRGVIAYLHGRRRETMQRMLAMGAVPGATVVLVQRFPSYVFQIGESQVAVDQETARDIYVRLTGRPAGPPAQQSWFPRQFRRMGFRWGRRRS